MKKNKINILDCTLRDGGYYNNWEFKKDLINEYLKVMDHIKVDYVEIGFRFVDKIKTKGPCAYSEESFLKSFQGANILHFDASKSEPYTGSVDSFCSKVKSFGRKIDAIIGVGGGSAMDVAKGVSIALTNPGSIAGYQGWDLVVNKPIFKLGIPTVFGSGSEASRTAVFNNGVKKQGVNSDYSMFDGIIILLFYLPM